MEKQLHNSCKIMKFKNLKNEEPVLFVIYCDFESILKKVNDKKLQKHRACTVGYYFICNHDYSKSYYRECVERIQLRGLLKSQKQKQKKLIQF